MSISFNGTGQSQYFSLLRYRPCSRIHHQPIGLAHLLENMIGPYHHIIGIQRIGHVLEIGWLYIRPGLRLNDDETR
jgi:hypothetical protein